MRGPGTPGRISVDVLRQRTYAALKAAGHRGVCPAVDNVRQAVYVLGNIGLNTKAISEALEVSLNYVRVAKRNNALKLLGEPQAEVTPKQKRQAVAENQELSEIPAMSWPIEKLHDVLQSMGEPHEWGHDAQTLMKVFGYDRQRLCELGFDVS